MKYRSLQNQSFIQENTNFFFSISFHCIVHVPASRDPSIISINLMKESQTADNRNESQKLRSDQSWSYFRIAGTHDR